MGGTATVLHKPDDYDTFVDMMAEASIRVPMRNLAYCLMPNHFHLSLWPSTTPTWVAGCTGSWPPMSAATSGIIARAGMYGEVASTYFPAQ